ncbi:MAG: peptidase S9 [Acidobacteriota bacterium]
MPVASTTDLENRRPFALRKVAVDPAGGGDADISPDGRRFVASSRRAGNWDIWLYEIDGGPPRQITVDPGEDAEAQWSLDGRKLAFTSTRAGEGKSVWLIDVESGTLERLTHGTEDEYPAWAHDGSYVVYSGGPWKVRDFYIIPSRGGDPIKITRQTVRAAGACSVHPSGRSILCHRYDAGTGDVVELRVPDGEERIITDDRAWDYKPEYSPDGRWIAFSRWDEGPSNIWVVPAAGGEPIRLTHGLNEDRWPTWDRSGTRLLFHRVADEGTGIQLLDRASGAVTRLVGADERPRQASLHPEGRLLAYCARVGDRETIKIRDLDTGAVRELGDSSRQACHPRWSPDGRHLAYVTRGTVRWEIAVATADGTGERLLTPAHRSLHSLYGPLSWSPDGRRIAFRSDTAPFESDLFLLDVESGSLERLTKDIWWDEAPSFTRDGDGLLFMSTRGGGWTWGIVTMRLADRAIERLSPSDYTEKNYPEQAPDGRTVWSVFDDNGVQSLVERSTDGAVRSLGEATVGGRWPSYTADGAHILFTSVEHSVEYWLAENVTGPGSPLAAARGSADAEDTASTVPPAVDFFGAETRTASRAVPDMGPYGAGRFRSAPLRVGDPELIKTPVDPFRR